MAGLKRMQRASSRLPRDGSSLLASMLATAGIVLAAGCSHIAPLGPVSTQFPPPRHLGSPIIVQGMRVQPVAATGGCPAGWVAVSLPAGGGPHVSNVSAVPAGSPQPVNPAIPAGTAGSPQPATPAIPAGPAGAAAPPPSANVNCYRPVGAPVTIADAAVSPVMTFVPPPGEANGPPLYGFIVAVPSVHVAAVSAVIRNAYDTASAVGIRIAGKLWQAPMVFEPFSGQRLEISLLSKNQALQVYRLLVPAG